MRGLLRKIGYIHNVSKGIESGAFQMSHVIVGALGGLPDHAASLRVTISFYLSCVFEVPSGILSDLIGYARTLVYACLCYAASCYLILFAVMASGHLSMVFLMISSFFSALGGALSSGAFQAFIQELVDKHAQTMRAGDQDNFRIRALSLAQKYGAVFSSFFPISLLLIVFLLARFGNGEEYLLLVPGAAFLVLACYFYKHVPDLYRGGGFESAGCWRKYRLQFLELVSWFDRSCYGLKMQLFSLIILLVISMLMMLHVHTYLIVSQMREYDIKLITLWDFLLVFLLLVSFDLAHLVKGLIVPYVSELFGEQMLLLGSYFGLVTLASSAVLGIFMGFEFTSLITFVLFFRAFLSLSQNVVQARILILVPYSTRATVLSFVQSIVMILYGAYSFYLISSGIEPPVTILIEIVFLSLASLVFLLFFLRGRYYVS